VHARVAAGRFRGVSRLRQGRGKGWWRNGWREGRERDGAGRAERARVVVEVTNRSGAGARPGPPVTRAITQSRQPQVRRRADPTHIDADYALRVDGEFVAAGRRGTAGSGVSSTLVFSCPGRIACGAPAGSQIRALGRKRPCRWPCRAVGGRASGVAAGPRSASQLGRGNRARQSPASGAAGRRARCQRGQPGKRAL